MQMLYRALDLIGFKTSQGPLEVRPNYQLLMEDALRRVRLAELQIREATTLEDLDIGRSSLLAAWAEVQQMVRSAKRERGITLRPVSETEEMHRKLRDFMNHRSESAVRRRTGTGTDLTERMRRG